MVVTPHAFSHRAIACKSSVNVSNTCTGCSSRSGGTATKISRAPISIPAALGSRHGRSARHIPFCFFRRPRWAWLLGGASLSLLFVVGHLQRSLAPDSGQIAQQKGTLWIGINLNQAVTTVWRTKPGTMLSIGLKLQHHCINGLLPLLVADLTMPQAENPNRVPLSYGAASRHPRSPETSARRQGNR